MGILWGIPSKINEYKKEKTVRANICMEVRAKGSFLLAKKSVKMICIATKKAFAITSISPGLNSSFPL